VSISAIISTCLIQRSRHISRPNAIEEGSKIGTYCFGSGFVVPDYVCSHSPWVPAGIVSISKGYLSVRRTVTGIGYSIIVAPVRNQTGCTINICINKVVPAGNGICPVSIGIEVIESFVISRSLVTRVAAGIGISPSVSVDCLVIGRRVYFSTFDSGNLCSSFCFIVKRRSSIGPLIVSNKQSISSIQIRIGSTIAAGSPGTSCDPPVHKSVSVGISFVIGPESVEQSLIASISCQEHTVTDSFGNCNGRIIKFNPVSGTAGYYIGTFPGIVSIGSIL